MRVVYSRDKVFYGMETRYGHLLEVWEAAKDEVRSILIERARQYETITYGELVQAVQIIHMRPDSYALSGILRELGAEDVAAGRGTLATLVVRKSDGRPGPGYFKDALQRGLSDEDIEAYWQAQFARVCEDWREE